MGESMSDRLAAEEAPIRAWNDYAEAVVRIEIGERVIEIIPATAGQCTGDFPGRGNRRMHILTACNPRGRVVDVSANDRACAELEATLQRMRVTFWPAVGGDAAWTHVERSVAVAGLDDATARAIGQGFGQDAIFAWSPTSWRLLSCATPRRTLMGWTSRHSEVLSAPIATR